MLRTATDGLSKAKMLPPRRAGRPKATDVQALTNHVVLVAREVFFEMGFGSATMDEIAQRARISKETLYTRFKDKATLFEAVMQVSLDAWAEGAANHPKIESSSLEEEIRHQVEQQVKGMRSPEFRNLTRVLLAELPNFPNLVKAFLDLSSSQRINLIADKIRHYAEPDGIPCRDPDSAAEALRGMISGWLQVIDASGASFDKREQDKFVMRIVEIFMASRPAW